MTHQQVTGVWLEWVVGEMAGDDRLLPAIAEIHKVLGRAVEPSSNARTDHAENLARALEHYLRAHDTLSSVADSDDATGMDDASDCGFHDAANDAWRAMRTALHEYRKAKPLQSLQGECPTGDYKRAEAIKSKDSRSESPALSEKSSDEYPRCAGSPHNCPYIFCHSNLTCAKTSAVRTTAPQEK